MSDEFIFPYFSLENINFTSIALFLPHCLFHWTRMEIRGQFHNTTWQKPMRFDLLVVSNISLFYRFIATAFPLEFIIQDNEYLVTLWHYIFRVLWLLVLLVRVFYFFFAVANTQNNDFSTSNGIPTNHTILFDYVDRFICCAYGCCCYCSLLRWIKLILHNDFVGCRWKKQIFGRAIGSRYASFDIHWIINKRKIIADDDGQEVARSNFSIWFWKYTTYRRLYLYTEYGTVEPKYRI